MRFLHDGKTYSISFQRFRPTGASHEHVRTKALLHTGNPLQKGPWTEIASATVTHHSEDDFDKELGRRFALQALVRKLRLTIGGLSYPSTKALIGKLLNAYYNRPRPKDVNALKHRIEQLQCEVAQIELERLKREPLQQVM